MVIAIDNEKQGTTHCINAMMLYISPIEKKNHLQLNEIWVGYDSEGFPWSDHMGGQDIDCTGKNVEEAINLVVTKLNERVKEF